MKFTIYKTATGQVMYCGDAADPSELPMADESLLEDVEHMDGYLVDGVHHQVPPQPSPHHIFDWTAKVWVDPRTLEERRAAQWEKLKAARDAFEFSFFIWDGSTFDGDQASQQRIQGAAQLAVLAQLTAEPFSIDWTLADNSVRTLDIPDMLGVGTAMATHVATAHQMGRVKRQQLEAATTLAEIEAVVW